MKKEISLQIRNRTFFEKMYIFCFGFETKICEIQNKR